MKKAMKRFVCLVLAVLLGLSLLSGCNGQEETKGNEPVVESEDKEPVTLHFYTVGFAGQEDADKVYAEVNKLIQAKYPWITVQFHVSNQADYSTHVALAQSIEDPMDIICSFPLSYQTEILNGAYMDITDLLSEFPDLMSALPEFAYGWGVVDGRTYGFPNWQQCNYGNAAMAVPKEVADKYGFDVDKVNQLIQAEEFFNPAVYDEIEKFLEAAKATGDTGVIFYPASYNVLGPVLRGYESVSGAIYSTWADETCQLVNIWETDAVKEYIKTVHEFADKGYIPEDFYTDSSKYAGAGLNAYNNGYTPFYFAGNDYVPNFPQLRKLAWGFDLYFMCTNKSDTEYYIASTYAAGLMAVGANSKYPKDALRVMELLYTDAEIQNMLTYGLEGEHYVKNDDGTITTLEYDSGQAGATASYGMMKWLLGNSGLTWINQSFDQAMYDWAFEALPETGTPSKLIGFTPDLSKVSNKVNSINSVVSEYASLLCVGGAENWEVTYNEFIEKLHAADIDTVMQILQGQINSFLASK